MTTDAPDHRPHVPTIISDYYSASENGDIGRLVACFSNRATVVDDGRTYVGRDEIHGWRAALASAFTYTLDITGVERTESGEYVVGTHVEGDFPGGVVDPTNRFTLTDGLIVALVI